MNAGTLGRAGCFRTGDVNIKVVGILRYHTYPIRTIPIHTYVSVITDCTCSLYMLCGPGIDVTVTKLLTALGLQIPLSEGKTRQCREFKN